MRSSKLSAVLAAIAGVALVLASARLNAQHADFDCVQLARGVSAFAYFRDTDADLEKVIALAIEKSGIRSLPHVAVIDREIRRMWREGLSPELAEQRLYQRCIQQLGRMVEPQT